MHVQRYLKHQYLNKNRSKSQGLEKLTLFRNELFDWPIPKVVQNKSRADISLPKPDGAKRSTNSNMLETYSAVTK